jgi:ATP-binding cassette subfamily C protein
MPLYIIIFLFFKSPLYQLKLKVSEEYSRYYASTDRFLANIKSIMLHEWQIRFLSRISESYEAVHSVTMQNARVGFMLANVDMIIRYLTNISIFIHCGYQVLRQNMSVGEFTMVNTYSTMIISCVGSILNFGKSHQQTMVSYDRLISLFNQKPDENGIIQPESVSEIKISNLTFSYGSKTVLESFSCSFQKGKIYAVVGENGTGKSTLLNILSGVEQNYSGLITFDGIDLKLLDRCFMRNQMLSIVEQEPDLLYSTLGENIAEQIDDSQNIIKRIEEFSLLDFFSSLGKNLEYLVADQSSNLSGGEKQKIATIRCLLKEAKVLILDEPNSAFDEESTDMLCCILEKLKKDKIIILITHRFELQEISDVTVSLDTNEILCK